MAGRTRTSSRLRPAPSPRRSRARSRLRRRGLPGLPTLEQRQLDLIGLGLVALASFLAFVFYLGWDGGRVGAFLASGLLLLFGAVAYVAPLALLAAGALMILRPMLPATGPFRTGAICLILAFCLGLAAGSLGLGPEAPRAGQDFITEPRHLRAHGGLLGETLFWVTRTLVQEIGTHVLFVFLLLAGLLVVTGASIAGFLQATGAGVAQTGRLTRRAVEPTARLTRRAVSTAWRAGEDGMRVEGGLGARTARARGDVPAWRARRGGVDEQTLDAVPPEELGDAGPVVRATHVEAPTATAGGLPAADLAEPPPDEVDVPEFLPGEAPTVDARRRDEGTKDRDEAPAASADPPALTPQGNARSPVAQSDELPYHLPSTRFLRRSDGRHRRDRGGDEREAALLVETLSHFGVEAKVIGSVAGPHVTRFELRLAPGTRMSKIAQLRDDLAYALAAEDVRILAPIPGKQAVGVEVPNAVRRTVHLGDVFQDAPAGWSPLTVWLGEDIAGKAIGADLAKQPHVLVAGTTGSGKSGCVNAMLASILLRATPNEVRVVLVDPKQVELNHYEGIPHLLTPVVTSPRLAANVLGNLIKEMEARYSVMSQARSRSLVELNKVREREGEAPLPYIVCVIDELADLMMIAPGEVEDAIIRLAQKSRAVGIHLVLATQRPSADIITGMIKANVPARIAFAVSSQTDSRVILDQNGAEALLGEGDMLFRPASESRLARIKGAFVTEPEIEELTDHWRRQGEPELQEELLETVESEEDEGGAFDPDADDLLGEAIATVVQMGTASTSMLQRRLRIGYTRAGRLVDMMERRGVISGYEGSKARQVLITEADLPRVLASLEQSSQGDLAEAGETVAVLSDEPA